VWCGLMFGRRTRLALVSRGLAQDRTGRYVIALFDEGQDADSKTERQTDKQTDSQTGQEIFF
jgi:hypothetical protein